MQILLKLFVFIMKVRDFHNMDGHAACLHVARTIANRFGMSVYM